MTDRRQESYAVRVEAAELARSRQHPDHQANGDEQRYAGDSYFMSFTKGLPHNPHTGLLHDPLDFVEFRRAIDDAFIDPFSDRVRHGAKYNVVLSGSTYEIEEVPLDDIPSNFRQWEAPTAGVVFELQGPDAQAVTMPPAPPLMVGEAPNPELVLEMAAVYELAVLRDQPFNALELLASNPTIDASIARLNALPYITNQTGRSRKVNDSGVLNAQTVFRGSSPGVEVGPYLSQFLLIGNGDFNGSGSVADGKIAYGALQVSQKVPIATDTDFMLTMSDYVAVQRGLRPPREIYEPGAGLVPNRRFISTPRDLATYVHYDALYEAYLNACLILLGMETPFDPSFDHLSGVGVAAGKGSTRRNAGGFALYGGPHILNLVTEVSTRALKAVRFQKFNNHIRLRPEALAARIHLMKDFENLDDPAKNTVSPTLKQDMDLFAAELDSNGTLNAIKTHNATKTGSSLNSYFLPMAFPEGSPMHPAYGAGHATVAGACVTILKAFFDTASVLAQDSDGNIRFKRYAEGDEAVIYRAPAIVPDPDPDAVLNETIGGEDFLTLEGELNKLAANISIGRNMAGVHFFTDYYDSLRMGEAIAIGILEEQALTYSTDPFVLSVPTFDGDVVRIGRR